MCELVSASASITCSGTNAATAAKLLRGSQILRNQLDRRARKIGARPLPFQTANLEGIGAVEHLRNRERRLQQLRAFDALVIGLSLRPQAEARWPRLTL
jgi:hypothetical protein